MSDVIPVRIAHGRRKHALPQAGGDQTLCGRAAARVLIDDGFPDCKACCREIKRLGVEVVEG